MEGDSASKSDGTIGLENPATSDLATTTSALPGESTSNDANDLSESPTTIDQTENSSKSMPESSDLVKVLDSESDSLLNSSKETKSQQGEQTATVSKSPNESTEEVDGFVLVDPPVPNDKNSDLYDPHFYYIVVESRLKSQLHRLEHYKQYFDQKCKTPNEDTEVNVQLVERLSTIASETSQDLDELTKLRKDPQQSFPQHSFQHIEFKAIPTNPELKDKELQISLQAKNLDASGLGASDGQLYVVVEFVFPPPSQETISDYLTRKYKEFKVQPSSLFTNVFSNKQVDKSYCVGLGPANGSSHDMVQFEPPITFHIDKGKSKSLRRKFKPVKVSVWRRGCFYDDHLGSVQFKIDEVNDQSTLSVRSQLKKRLRTRGECLIDAQIKVREPLVNKEPRLITEELLKYH